MTTSDPIGRVRLVHESGEAVTDPHLYQEVSAHGVRPEDEPTDHEMEVFNGLTRRERFITVMEWHRQHRLTPLMLQRLLPATWVHGGSRKHELPDVSPESITAMFRYAGFVTNLPEKHIPTGPVTLYRGANPDGVYGFSWTPNRSYAATFAMKAIEEGHQGLLLEAQIDPRYVLAIVEVDAPLTFIEYVIDGELLRREGVPIVREDASQPEIMAVAKEAKRQSDLGKVKALQADVAKLRHSIDPGPARLDDALIKMARMMG